MEIELRMNKQNQETSAWINYHWFTLNCKINQVDFDFILDITIQSIGIISSKSANTVLNHLQNVKIVDSELSI